MKKLNAAKIVPNKKNNDFLIGIGTKSLKKPTSFKEMILREKFFMIN